MISYEQTLESVISIGIYIFPLILISSINVNTTLKKGMLETTSSESMFTWTRRCGFLKEDTNTWGSKTRQGLRRVISMCIRDIAWRFNDGDMANYIMMKEKDDSNTMLG